MNEKEEMEAKITALILGELSAEEAATVRKAIAEDADLARLHDRLRHTIELVREAAVNANEAAVVPATRLRFSPQRRDQLLQAFKTVAPAQFASTKPQPLSWFLPMASAAALVVILVGLLLPATAKSKAKAQRIMARRELQESFGRSYAKAAALEQLATGSTEFKSGLVAQNGAVTTASPSMPAPQRPGNNIVLPPVDGLVTSSASATEMQVMRSGGGGGIGGGGGGTKDGVGQPRVDFSVADVAYSADGARLPNSTLGEDRKAIRDESVALPSLNFMPSQLTDGRAAGIEGTADSQGKTGVNLPKGAISGTSDLASSQEPAPALRLGNANGETVALNEAVRLPMPDATTSYPRMELSATAGLAGGFGGGGIGGGGGFGGGGGLGGGIGGMLLSTNFASPARFDAVTGLAMDGAERSSEARDKIPILGDKPGPGAFFSEEAARKLQEDASSLLFHGNDSSFSARSPESETAKVEKLAKLEDKIPILGDKPALGRFFREEAAAKETTVNPAPPTTQASAAAVESERLGEAAPGSTPVLNQASEGLAQAGQSANTTWGFETLQRSEKGGVHVVGGSEPMGQPNEVTGRYAYIVSPPAVTSPAAPAKPAEPNSKALAAGSKAANGNLGLAEKLLEIHSAAANGTVEAGDVSALMGVMPPSSGPAERGDMKAFAQLNDLKEFPAERAFGAREGNPQSATTLLHGKVPSKEVGDQRAGVYKLGAAWGDHDDDGHLDLFTGLPGNNAPQIAQTPPPEVALNLGNNVQRDLRPQSVAGTTLGVPLAGLLPSPAPSANPEPQTVDRYRMDPQLAARYGLAPRRPLAESAPAGARSESDSKRMAGRRQSESTSDLLLPEDARMQVQAIAPQGPVVEVEKSWNGPVTREALPGPAGGARPGAQGRGEAEFQSDPETRKVIAVTDSETKQQIAGALTSSATVSDADQGVPPLLFGSQSSLATLSDKALGGGGASRGYVSGKPEQNISLFERLREKVTGTAERSAQVEVAKDNLDVAPLLFGNQSQAQFDPYFVQTEFEKVKSKQVLNQVIANLNLDETLAKQSGTLGKLTQDQAYERLAKIVDVRQNGDKIDIRVKDANPQEAARIANTIADVYRQVREQNRQQAAQLLAERESRAVAAQESKPQPSSAPAQPMESDKADVAPPKLAPTAAVPQPEVQTQENAFSTFSLNVSDVSFKLAAASLEKGVIPDPATVRSEEFINAFDYHDPEPAPGMAVGFAWERARYSFAHDRDVLRFSVKTAAQGRSSAYPLNLVLLLDKSGSMERADRVRIIGEALRVLAGQLRPLDKLSIITFARTPHLWADGVPGNQAGQAVEQVEGQTPEGGTNLEDAMNLAYQTARRHYIAGGGNRVVLLTDGAANLGNVQPEALKRKVEAQRQQGVALDCYGIGWEGFNDDLLEVLSSHGDGRYGFLNTPEEAAQGFAGQLAGALRVAAADVKVQVEFNPERVTVYRQIGYAKHQLTKEQFRDNTVDAAELGAAESGNALYVVRVDARGEGDLATVRVRYKVPNTSEYREQSWAVPYTGAAAALEQASPAVRLAASASAFSEWLVSSPYSGEVTPDRLLGCLRGVPEVYGADSRPTKLEWMIRQAKSLSGK